MLDYYLMFDILLLNDFMNGVFAVLNNLNEYAAIVALARLAGVEGSKEEVYNKFWETYQAVLKEPSEDSESNSVDVFRRPF